MRKYGCMSKYIICVIYVLFTVSGLILMKYGTSYAENVMLKIPIINFRLSTFSLLGLLCYGISFCLYMGVVSNFNLGVIIPIMGGIVNVLVLLASVLILKEKLSWNMVLGACIIIVGIVIMNIGQLK